MPRIIYLIWFTTDENTYLRVRVNCCSFDFTKSPTVKVVQPRKLRYKMKQNEKKKNLYCWNFWNFNCYFFGLQIFPWYLETFLHTNLTHYMVENCYIAVNMITTKLLNTGLTGRNFSLSWEPLWHVCIYYEVTLLCICFEVSSVNFL